MKSQNVRVLVASENPETRTILRRIVANEDKAVIVAEAENGTRALTLARSMHPDVALIDSHHPYVAGMDNIPLSRIVWMDTAQSISEEIPNMHVVLLNSLNDNLLADTSWRLEKNALLCRESNQTCIPFTLSSLSALNRSPGVIFANVQSQAEAAPQHKTSRSDKTIFAGVLGIVAGWLMILTMFLATAGLYVLLAGVTAALFGLLGKVSSKIFK